MLTQKQMAIKTNETRNKAIEKSRINCVLRDNPAQF